MKILAKYAIEPRDDAFVLRLEDAEGEATDYALTADQLDELIELADELLEEDDSEHESEDGEIYQKPLG